MADSNTATDNGRALGFWACFALVAGNIVGAGVFLLPTQLAPYGLNGVYGWLVTISGSLCLAFVLARLAGRIEGGPYAYTRDAFGEPAAFAVMWSYWISVWTATPSLAIAAISNLSLVFPALGGPVVAPAAEIALLLLFTLVNVKGARAAGGVQLVGTVLKLIPLAGIVILAAWLFGTGHAPEPELAPMPVSAAPIASTVTLTLFLMLGFESATLPVGKVRDPARTVPRATLAGTAAAGLVYLLACTSVLLLLPASVAANSPSPFGDAAARFLGSGAGAVFAVFAAVSALGALNGWVLCSGEVPLAMARGGAFPAWLGATDKRGTPIRALWISTGIAALLILSNASRSMAGLYAFMILVSTLTALVLYFACAAAALKLRRGRALGASGFVVVTLAGLVYALWAFWGSGAEATLWALALVATGLPVWLAMRRTRRLQSTA